LTAFESSCETDETLYSVDQNKRTNRGGGEPKMKSVIIDTDIGLGTTNAEIDDGLALSYAFSKSKDMRIAGITTVFGNVVGNQTYKNVLNLLRAFNLGNIRAEKGALKPLRDQQQVEPSAEAAAELVIEAVQTNPGQITLVCIGPLTNIAAALIMEPNLARNIKEVYIMGGAIEVPGNVTPTAEFNIYSDPIAAKIVFNSKMPMTLIPLDVTTKTLLMQKHLNELKSVGGSKIGYLVKWVEPWLRFQEQTLKLGGGNLHDPLTVAIAIDGTLAKMKQMNVDVETKGDITKGMTVAERRQFMAPRTKNMNVCTEIDEPRFMEQFMNSLKSLAQK
jgi:inosine-uridine nucleoside N-ribohydrolase